MRLAAITIAEGVCACLATVTIAQLCALTLYLWVRVSADRVKGLLFNVTFFTSRYSWRTPHSPRHVTAGTRLFTSFL